MLLFELHKFLVDVAVVPIVVLLQIIPEVSCFDATIWIAWLFGHVTACCKNLLRNLIGNKNTPISTDTSLTANSFTKMSWKSRRSLAEAPKNRSKRLAANNFGMKATDRSYFSFLRILQQGRCDLKNKCNFARSFTGLVLFWNYSNSKKQDRQPWFYQHWNKSKTELRKNAKRTPKALFTLFRLFIKVVFVISL